MIVLGLILVIVAIAAGVLLFLATSSLTEPVTLDAAGYSVGMTPLALLVTGAVVLLLLWLGLALIRGAVRRRARPRREAKEAQRQAEFEENIRADERARAEEVHQEQLAERDRVREQEFESRWAERDRGREEEYRSRQADDEQRIRADERARVERELAERQHSGPGAGAGAVGAGVAGAGAAAAWGHDAGQERADVPTEHGAAVVTPDHSAGGTTHDHLADTSGSGADDEAGFREHHHDGSPTVAEAPEESSADDGVGASEPSSPEATQPPYRTVADKLMGRNGPEDDTQH